MKYVVTSDRQPWPRGTVLGARDLRGCNIDALVYGGHLAPAPASSKPRKVVVETAEEPEEQQ